MSIARGRPELEQIVVNARDPSSLARFWARVLDGRQVDRDRGWSHVDARGFPRLAFQPSDAETCAGNSVHLDVQVPDVQQAIDAFRAAGAAVVGPMQTSELGMCQVMADPEGNRFCLVADAVG